MKRYRLLKDLPYIEAGAVFVRKTMEDSVEIIALESPDDERPGLIVDKIIDFDEWFVEIEIYFYITAYNVVCWDTIGANEELEDNRKAVGNYFKTREQAEKCLEYLKAKAIIKQDTNGYKPNWNDINKTKYHGQWDYKYDCPRCAVDWTLRDNTICFETREEAEESFKKHPEEWKTYLTYEQ